MNEKIFTIALVGLGSCIAAIRRDWQSYRDAKKLDPTETYKWGLGVLSGLDGLAQGLLLGLGGTTVAESL